MNKPREELHYRQANDRLRAIDRRRFEGLMGMEQYRQERREILNFLTGVDPETQETLALDLPEYSAASRRRWWRAGK
ncbi:MAG: hypothetical protein VXW65_01570 [Pseudomonadota bacterium]|nr:hypothetical protein [Pseudomonadota bacterium]